MKTSPSFNCSQSMDASCLTTGCLLPFTMYSLGVVSSTTWLRPAETPPWRIL